jgi:putative oxidoreductase
LKARLEFAIEGRSNRQLFQRLIRAFLAISHLAASTANRKREVREGILPGLCERERNFEAGENVDQAYAPYGMFLLRLAIGIDWLAHAFLKIYRGMNTHEALLAKNGITPLLAWPTFTLEVIGGIAIILGWYSRQWAAFLLFFLATVVWIKWPVGWTYSNTGGGWEYPLFWLFAQAALVLGGEGAFALRRSPFPKMA